MDKEEFEDNNNNGHSGWESPDPNSSTPPRYSFFQSRQHENNNNNSNNNNHIDNSELEHNIHEELESIDKSTTNVDLFEMIVSEMQSEHGLDVRDRKWMLRTYPMCFIGSECVDWLIQNNHVKSREDAVVLGQHLLENNIFSHVTKDHQFKDEFLFYRFKEHFKEKKRVKDSTLSSLNPKSWRSLFETFEPLIENSNLQPEIPISPPELIKTMEELEIYPLDDYNAKLLDYVHPNNHSDPQVESKDVYNLAVIGAGAGGLVSAVGSAGLGAKVALIEMKLMGGDCLNFGCVPSKALLRCSKLISDLRQSEKLGVVIKGFEVDFPAIMARMRKIRAEIAVNDSVSRIENLGVDVFIGHAKFSGKDSIEVNGQTIYFSKAVIASGASPAIPPIPGIQSVPYLTNTTIFNLTKLPESLLVIGAGAIGCELSQAFANFGSKVILTNRSARILVREEEFAASIVHKALETDGVKILLSVTIHHVEKLENGKIAVNLTSNNEEVNLIVDHILVSVGKKPNVENMGLEVAGVEFDQQKGVMVSKQLQTTNKNIFAVGDCCSKYKFTHVADSMARLVIRNALFFGNATFDVLVIPWAVYTSPEIAHVGLYPADLIRKKIAFDVYERNFAEVDRAKVEEEVGFVRIYTAHGNDKILGCTIVAPNAGDMISEVTLAITNSIGLASIATTIHPYPTFAEAIRQIGDMYNRSRLTPTVRTLFRKLFSTYRHVKKPSLRSSKNK